MGLIANASAEAASIEGVAQTICGTAWLFQNTALLIHEGTIRPRDHPVPGKELGGSRTKLSDG
jgi:hypothetical protein